MIDVGAVVYDCRKRMDRSAVTGQPNILCELLFVGQRWRTGRSVASSANRDTRYLRRVESVTIGKGPQWGRMSPPVLLLGESPSLTL
jgi:hypothetical protein